MSFNAFKDDEPDALEPPFGNHTASLITGRISRDEKWLILEWQTIDLAHYWTSFHGLTGGQKAFTKRALDKLGIDLGEMGGWDDVVQAITARQGHVFMVRYVQNGTFKNTEILDRPEVVQTELPVEVPPVPKATTAFDDDDVPF
jgi:hypothetical protein